MYLLLPNVEHLVGLSSLDSLRSRDNSQYQFVKTIAVFPMHPFNAVSLRVRSGQQPCESDSKPAS